MDPYGPNLFVILDPKLRLFDEVSVSDSEISVLSDPFCDDERENVAPTSRKKIDLTGRDVFEAFEFSPKFQKAIIKEGEPRPSIASMLAESPEQIRARSIFTQIRKKVPLMVQIKIGALLNDKEIRFGVECNEKTFIPDEKKTWEDIKDEILKSRSMMKNIRRLTEMEKSRKILLAQQEQEAYETMSGYWRLLGDYQQFNFSPPGYDAYAGVEPHWLEMEQIPWSVMAESREKVLNWFMKYFAK